MTEEELRAIEVLLGINGVGKLAAPLVAEIRQLQKRLEETENLLARATIDEEQFGLGRADGIGIGLRILREEERHLEVLIDDPSVQGSERTAFNRAYHYVGLLADKLENLGALPAPLPPERMRERIRVLEESLGPFAKYGEHLNDSVDAAGGTRVSFQDVYPDKTIIRADFEAKPHKNFPATAGDCRCATKVLNEKPA